MFTQHLTLSDDNMFPKINLVDISGRKSLFWHVSFAQIVYIYHVYKLFQISNYVEVW